MVSVLTETINYAKFGIDIFKVSDLRKGVNFGLSPGKASRLYETHEITDTGTLSS